MKASKTYSCSLLAILLVSGCNPDEPAILPTVTTDKVVSITQVSAVLMSTVTSDGNSDIISSGVVLDITTAPDLERSTVHDSGEKSEGEYPDIIIGLLPNTTYYVRAYVTNSVGTTYGNELSFTTLADVSPDVQTSAASNIKFNSATIVVNIGQKGTAPVITEVGLVYGISTHPTVADTKLVPGAMSFSADLKNLTQNTTYYARGYAVTRSGISYGNEISFSTPVAVPPTVKTFDATDITFTGATVKISVDESGSSPVTDRGIVFNNSGSPTLSEGTKVASGNGTGTATISLADLQEGITYFVRAFATSDVGTSYGNEISFQPTVSTPPSPLGLPASYRGTWHDLQGEEIYLITDDEIVSLPSYISYLFDPISSVTAVTGGYDVVGKRIGSSESVTYNLRQGIDQNSLAIGLQTYWQVVGRSVYDVRFGTGNAALAFDGASWKEKDDQGIELSWIYTETSRTDWSVFLTRNDGARFQIDVSSRSIYWSPTSGGTMTLLYTLTEMYSY